MCQAVDAGGEQAVRWACRQVGGRACMPVGEQAYKQLGGWACQYVGGPSTSAVFTAEVLLVSNWIPDHGHGSSHRGCGGPARSASRLRLIESRRQMGREVPLKLSIARTGATWASNLRHISSGALLQVQAPVVRMDYKKDTVKRLWRHKSDDRRYSNPEICRTKDR